MPRIISRLQALSGRRGGGHMEAQRDRIIRARPKVIHLQMQAQGIYLSYSWNDHEFEPPNLE